jgi:hypothetical protein
MDKYLIKTKKTVETEITRVPTDEPLNKKKKVNRKYFDSYLKYGFIDDESEYSQPLCVLCLEKLSNECMKPSKLKRHFETKHPNDINKPLEYFISKKTEYIQQKNCINKTITTADNALRASNMVSLHIAKNKKAPTIGENLIIPAVIQICRVMFGEEYSKKVQSIPLSNTTVRRRIDEMSENVENQLISRLKSRSFCLQIDETTDMSKCAQLLTYIRYVYESEMEEELLFCHELETYTTSNL